MLVIVSIGEDQVFLFLNLSNVCSILVFYFSVLFEIQPNILFVLKACDRYDRAVQLNWNSPQVFAANLLHPTL